MENAAQTKIGIIGLGPVGAILAVKFREAGCDVALCVRNEVKRNKILEEGIVLEGAIQARASFGKVFASAAEMAGLDLDFLVFAVKSYQIPGALEDCAGLHSEKLHVVAALSQEKSSLKQQNERLRYVFQRDPTNLNERYYL